MLSTHMTAQYSVNHTHGVYNNKFKHSILGRFGYVHKETCEYNQHYLEVAKNGREDLCDKLQPRVGQYGTGQDEDSGRRS